MNSNNQTLLENLSFTINYVPSAIKTVFKYCVLGSMIGYASGFMLRSSLKEYARTRHNEVDITRHYVPDDEQFLRFSRGVNNTVTPPISEFLPIYSTLLGATAGLFFSANVIRCGYLKRLEEQDETTCICV